MAIDSFDIAMVERYLNSRGWRFDRTGDHKVVMKARAGERDVWVKFKSSRSAPGVCTIRVQSDHEFAREDRGRLLERANRWNSENRWPTAYVVDIPATGGIQVVGKSSYNFGSGVHFDLFTALANNTILGAVQMLDDIGTSMKLPRTGSFEAWFRLSE